MKGKILMKVYIDFDDVLCETAKHFTKLAKELFGIDVPYREVQFFNLKKTFDLSDVQYEEMMIAGHLPENLLNYEETTGAADTINKWLDEGHEIFIITGRPFNSYEPSRKWLDEHKIFFEERPIIEENPTYEELKEWYEKSGMPLKKFFNTSGMLYKQMNLKDKLPEMSEDEQLKLLATDGMLVKRPLVVGEDFVLTGFREKEWEEKIRG